MMKTSRFWATALLGISALGGIVCTTRDSSAQQSALADAKARAQKAPASPDAAIAYGRALRRAGREGEALAELKRGQVFAKGDAAVAIGWEISRTHVAKRDFAPAMSACKSVAKVANGAAASRVCAAEAHLLWRRGTEALAELAELAKLPAADATVRFHAKLAEGRARELDSKDVEAEAAYREAIRLAPDRVEGHVLLGAMLQRAGKDGAPSLRRAVELDAHDPIAQLELGRALASDPARRPEAIAAFEKAVAERPTLVDALRGLTEAYVAERRLSDAKRVASSVLRLAPNDVLAHVVSGRVALADGKPDAAIEAGQTALKLMPNEGKAKLLIADAYAKKGEIDLALEAYQKASGLDPLNPAPLVNATNACIAAGRLTSAKAFGQRAVLDFPDHAPSWIAQGDALAADGNPKAARSAYEAAKKARGADAAVIDGKLSRLK
ncbi:MAG: tetratricopeptide repeat protein [Labilithrix sp.]|nr:tetratricopeptide repeat protein [Labilithrix sp.]